MRELIKRLAAAAVVAASYLAFRRWRSRTKPAADAADVQRTPSRDFRDAVLTGADLRRAPLAHADFTGADLTGACLHEADLRGANLSGAKGLSAPQLSGADLASAQLPSAIAGFDGLSQVGNLSKNAARTFAFLVFSCLYSWVTIAMTTDARLLTRFVSSPLPVIQTAIPLFLFYIVAPFIITALYLYMHLQLQGLWEEIAGLPAVFPDGRTLTSKVHPWLLTAITQRVDRGHSASRFLEMAIAWLSAWWLGPVTLVIFWMRYLPRHDLIGSDIQVALLGLSAVVGAWSHQRAFEVLAHERSRASSLVPAALGTILLIGGAILSYGAIRGIDEVVENRMTPAHFTGAAVWLRTSVPSLLSRVGVRVFANMQNAAVSERPANWSFAPAPKPSGVSGDQRTNGNETVSDDLVRSVAGANLTGKRLSYADARGAFLVRADLTEATLRGADLSFAMLQRAVLHKSDLQLAYVANAHLENADLTGADLTNAYLGEAHLEGADLRDADLRGAILTNAHLEGAHLSFARLDGAILSNAELRGATLTWTSLRGANLGSADFDPAQLAYAYTNVATILPTTRLPVPRDCGIAAGPPPELRGGVYKIVLKSDANTCASSPWPPRDLSPQEMLQLDAAPAAAMPFGHAAVGAFFTWTPAPSGSPRGTEVINIPPGDGRSGYFKWTFIAPKEFSRVHVEGRANADDAGRVFLNGTPISPSLLSPNAIRQFADVKFGTDDASLIRRGAVNEIVLSDVNIGAGPSGAAFYVEITFRK